MSKKSILVSSLRNKLLMFRSSCQPGPSFLMLPLRFDLEGGEAGKRTLWQGAGSLG